MMESRRPVGPQCQISAHPIRPFRQDLKLMLRTQGHHREYAVDEFVRYVLMEQVGHRVHEYQTRLAPVQWLLELLWHKSDIARPHRPAVRQFGQPLVFPARAAEPVSLLHGVA